MEQIFEGSYIDPFDISASSQLVKFATGVITTPEVEKSLEHGKLQLKSLYLNVLLHYQVNMSRRRVYMTLFRAVV